MKSVKETHIRKLLKNVDVVNIRKSIKKLTGK